MAKFGMLIFMLLPLLGNVYVLWHVWRILPLPSWAKVVVVTLSIFQPEMLTERSVEVLTDSL